MVSGKAFQRRAYLNGMKWGMIPMLGHCTVWKMGTCPQAGVSQVGSAVG